MPVVVLLGPQRLKPTLVEAFQATGVTGPVAAVTAGWEEREDEIEELSEHLARPVRDLLLLRREAVAEHREEIGRVLAVSSALAIAGGHVGMLLDRMRMFGVAELWGEKPVFAWSGGAMVASEEVVLFHDRPPQGAGRAEVL